jgi:hypothetical protein
MALFDFLRKPFNAVGNLFNKAKPYIPFTPEWQQRPSNVLGGKLVSKTGAAGQGLAGLTEGMMSLIKPKPLFENIPEPTTFGQKAARFAGGLAGFAAGPGKLIAPFEAGVASKLGLTATKQMPILQKILTKSLPALFAKNIASSAIQAPIQSLIEGRPLKETFKEQAGSSIAGEALFGPAFAGVAALSGIKIKGDA